MLRDDFETTGYRLEQWQNECNIRVMSLLEKLKHNKKVLLVIASKRGASNIRVFGSVSREEETASSDIDFLVTLEPGRSLLDLVGLQQDLSSFLLRKVDVITDDGLNKYLRDRIIHEARPL